ncbi:MAG: alpha/beta fold hydrolase [Pyrinomonadaceae bacterium]
MKTQNLSLVHHVLEPRERPSTARAPLLVLLHGIGSNEDDLYSLAPYLDGRLMIVSARAPVVMGAGSFGWFNIDFTPQGMVVDMEQADESRRLILKFIDELVETYEADPACVVLMGFSQGAMMSLSAALTQPERVAAVAAMSGRLPAQALTQMAAPESLRGMPIFVAHGIYDPVLPIESGRDCRRKLEALPVELTYREYPMAHEVSMESLRDVAAWLSSTLNARCSK